MVTSLVLCAEIMVKSPGVEDAVGAPMYPVVAEARTSVPLESAVKLDAAHVPRSYS